MERLSEIKKLGKRLDDIKKETIYIKNEIKNLGVLVVKELTKIEGWKNLVENNLFKFEYERNPKDFIEWCEYIVEDGKLLVTKEYSNDPEYIFLEIDLNIPLDTQVETVTVQKKTQSEIKNKIELQERYDNDMVVLRNMGMEELSFDEWKERIKVN